MPRAFITGITGQDGQHLAEFLHGKGYDVFGMVKGQNNPKATAVLDRYSVATTAGKWSELLARLKANPPALAV